MAMIGQPNAANDLGLGSMLSTQTQDQLEEERKRREMGLSQGAKNSLAAQQLFGFGQTGIGTVNTVAGMGLGLNGRRF